MRFAGDAAYRLVGVFRDNIAARVFAMLTAPARRRATDFEFDVPSSFEGPLWRLLQQRPIHLLSVEYADWDALLFAAFEQKRATAARLPQPCNL